MIYTIPNQDRYQFADLLSTISQKISILSGTVVDLSEFDEHTTFLVYVDYKYGVSGIVYLEQDPYLNEWSLLLMNLNDELPFDQALLLAARFSKAAYDSLYMLALDKKIEKIFIQEDAKALGNLKALQWPLLREGSRTYLGLKKPVREYYHLNYMRFFNEIQLQMTDFSNVVFMDDWKKTKKAHIGRPL